MYDNIIIGGTYAAAGFCSGSAGKNLILSRNIYIEDYSPAFRQCRLEYNTEAGQVIYDYFKAEGIVNEGLLSPAEAAVRMYKMAEEKQWNILYQTFVSEVRQETDGYTVKVHNWEGASILHCREVIDTIPRGRILKKTFNALITTETSPGQYDGFEITKAYFNGQYILKCEIEPAASMTEARIALVKLLHSGKLKNPKLILTAVEFERRLECEQVPYCVIPSCNDENPVESFEKGFEMGRVAG